MVSTTFSPETMVDVHLGSVSPELTSAGAAPFITRWRHVLRRQVSWRFRGRSGSGWGKARAPSFGERPTAMGVKER